MIECLILYNIIVFFVYGIDKRKAIKNKRRISEKTLLMLAFFFGSVGSFIGMLFFHHKTKKLKFKLCIPLFLIIHIFILIVNVKCFWNF